MKNLKKRLILLVVLLISLSAASALSIYTLTFPQRITIADPYSIPENGAISISFDDTYMSQYQYAWPLMKERGMVGTFYIRTANLRDTSGNDDYMGSVELIDLQNHGCEIASHTHSHPNFVTLTESEIREECVTSKQILESYGLTVNNFAYPWESSNSYVDSIVADYYRSGRYGWGIMGFPVARFKLLDISHQIRDDDFEDFTRLKWTVDEVYKTKGWGIVFFHRVNPVDTIGWITSTEHFEMFLDYIIEKNITVLTVNQGLDVGHSSPSPEPKIKVYFDSGLSKELLNATMVNWGRRQKGENYMALWVKNIGAVSVRLSFTVNSLPANWSLTWDYKNQIVEAESSLKVAFTLTVNPDAEQRTYDFAPLQITATET